MRKTIAMIGVLATMASPLWADDPRQAQLTVTGQGMAEVVPDMARISLGVTRQAATAGDALDAVAQVSKAIFARLEAVGIAPRDMQSTQVNLSPQYDYNRKSDGSPKLVGFNANTMVSVRVRDLSGLGPIMTAVTEDGANQLNGLQFDLQDRGPAEDAARADAVKDAMARAKVLAEAAGVKLGSVLSIHDGGGHHQPAAYGGMELASARSDMPIAAGELEIGASVTMVFELDED